jgi:hypothetical protein
VLSANSQSGFIAVYQQAWASAHYRWPNHTHPSSPGFDAPRQRPLPGDVREGFAVVLRHLNTVVREVSPFRYCDGQLIPGGRHRRASLEIEWHMGRPRRSGELRLDRLSTRQPHLARD